MSDWITEKRMMLTHTRGETGREMKLEEKNLKFRLLGPLQVPRG